MSFFPACKQNKSLSLRLHYNTCHMKRFDQENLFLCFLSTSLIYPRLASFLSVLSLVFQTVVTQPHSKYFCIALKDIKWHFIVRVFIIFWYTTTKGIFRCLDKQWYQWLIKLIAYNITTVLSIIAWDLIRYHHLTFIDGKYISYLSLSIEVFSSKLFLTKF